jgi:hypothetical protein
MGRHQEWQECAQSSLQGSKVEKHETIKTAVDTTTLGIRLFITLRVFSTIT